MINHKAAYISSFCVFLNHLYTNCKLMLTKMWIFFCSVYLLTQGQASTVRHRVTVDTRHTPTPMSWDTLVSFPGSGRAVEWVGLVQFETTSLIVTMNNTYLLYSIKHHTYRLMLISQWRTFFFILRTGILLLKSVLCWLWNAISVPFILS